MTQSTPNPRPVGGNQSTVQVSRWLLIDIMGALEAATTISRRSCRAGDGLDTGNHDRLIREIKTVLDSGRAGEA